MVSPGRCGCMYQPHGECRKDRNVALNLALALLHMSAGECDGLLYQYRSPLVLFLVQVSPVFAVQKCESSCGSYTSQPLVAIAVHGSVSPGGRGRVDFGSTVPQCREEDRVPVGSCSAAWPSDEADSPMVGCNLMEL